MYAASVCCCLYQSITQIRQNNSLGNIYAPLFNLLQAAGEQAQQQQTLADSQAKRQQRELDKAHKKLAALQEQLSAAAAAGQGLEQQLQASKAAEATLQQQLEAAAQQLLQERQGKQQQQVVVQQGRQEVQQARGHVQELTQQLQHVLQGLDQQGAEMAGVKEELRVCQEQLAAAKVASRDASLASAQQGLMFQQQKSELQIKLEQQESAARQLRARCQALEQHLKAAVEGNAGTAQGLELQLRQELAERQQQVEQLQEEVAGVKREAAVAAAQSAQQMLQLRDALADAKGVVQQQKGVINQQQRHMLIASSGGVGSSSVRGGLSPKVQELLSQVSRGAFLGGGLGLGGSGSRRLIGSSQWLASTSATNTLSRPLVNGAGRGEGGGGFSPRGTLALSSKGGSVYDGAVGIGGFQGTGSWLGHGSLGGRGAGAWGTVADRGMDATVPRDTIDTARGAAAEAAAWAGGIGGNAWQSMKDTACISECREANGMFGGLGGTRDEASTRYGGRKGNVCLKEQLTRIDTALEKVRAGSPTQQLHGSAAGGEEVGRGGLGSRRHDYEDWEGRHALGGSALLASIGAGAAREIGAGTWDEGAGAQCGEEGSGGLNEDFSEQELGQLCTVSQLIDCAKGLLGALQEGDAQG